MNASVLTASHYGVVRFGDIIARNSTLFGHHGVVHLFLLNR